MKQYIVDAFTDKPFSGNPAAVCMMENCPSEESMMKLAMENNLSETAFGIRPKKAMLGLDLICVFGNEEQVCGSAHCQIATFWSGVLKRPAITAYQASKRGGYLHCELLPEGRIAISGEAVLVAVSDIKTPL